MTYSEWKDAISEALISNDHVRFAELGQVALREDHEDESFPRMETSAQFWGIALIAACRIAGIKDNFAFLCHAIRLITNHQMGDTALCTEFVISYEEWKDNVARGLRTGNTDLLDGLYAIAYKGRIKDAPPVFDREGGAAIQRAFLDIAAKEAGYIGGYNFVCKGAQYVIQAREECDE